jgi:hypothetical protein
MINEEKQNTSTLNYILDKCSMLKYFGNRNEETIC